MRRSSTPRKIQLRCTCGAMLKHVNAAGEFHVMVVRRCTCGLTWRIELQRERFDETGLPIYAPTRLETIDTPLASDSPEKA